MQKINPEDPMMPVEINGIQVGSELVKRYSGGLSIRAELAARAMQGIMSNPDFSPISDFEGAAKRAIMMADALIAELNREG